MSTQQQSLYTRDFGSRPMLVLGGALAVVALVVALALVFAVPLVILVAVPIAAGGVAGFLTATTRLDVTEGHVVCRSRLRERSFAASDLVIERRGTSNVYVLAPVERDRKVVCSFADDDDERVREVFTAAGVTIR
jgi:hypothetical protein